MRRIEHQRRRRNATAFPDALALAVAGEQDGFRVLFECYSTELLAFARARAADDPEALANECFVRAFSRIESFRGDEADFRSWLFAILRNLAIDDARRRARRPVRSNEELTAASLVAGDDPAGEATSVVGGAAMIEVLSELTDDQRDVVALRVLADLSIADVATIVGKPESAVKALQYRGLRTLARIISDAAVSSEAAPALSDT